MKQLNWNLFKSKFNGKERSSFESLSYQLFCAEHNNRIGIFRFKNQTGIETQPIKVNDDWIGFQSKYYETKLVTNKAEIIDSIKKAKRENSNLTCIFFYVNQEFSESSTIEKKDPAYKTEIEEEAKQLEVLIDWRVPSHFERQLALPENQYLTDHFFGNESSVFNFLDGLKRHTDNLFHSIQTDILFGEKRVKIDRTEIVADLTTAFSEAGSKAFILSGEGGSGKTAILKEYYQSQGNKIPFYVFKAVEFNIQEINELFLAYGKHSLKDLILVHEKETIKVAVIDSAERITDLGNQEPFKEFLAELLKASWTVVFTTRLSYLDDLRFQLLSIYRIPFGQININSLSETELDELSAANSFELPSNERMKALIQNLFYLDEYLRNYNSESSSVQYRKFKNKIWLRKIQDSTFTKSNIHIQREKCFLNICQIRSIAGTFFISPTNCSEEALSLLIKDEIIAYDNSAGGYFITHDIYEEWGLEMFIDRSFISSTKYSEFISQIGSSLVARRAFRQWLSDKIFDDIDHVKSFIEEVIESNKIESFWRDEVITSVLLSDYSGEFFKRFRDKIIEGEFALLRKIIFLLRVSCKSIDDTFLMDARNPAETNLKYVFTKPKGTGWKSAILFINQEKDLLSLSKINFTIPLLIDWCSKNHRGEATRAAGIVALKFYNDIQSKEHHYEYAKLDESLQKIMIHSSYEIKAELAEIFSSVIKQGDLNNQIPHFDFCSEVISSDIDNVSIIKALPEQILKLADLFWLEPKKKSGLFDGGMGTESYYGLNEYGEKYFPASAYQTPVLWLLRFAPLKAIDFIIKFINQATRKYYESGFDENVTEIEIWIEKSKPKKQYHSQALWNMYRGTSSPVTPYLLQSIHMALEKYLFEIAKTQDAKVVEGLLVNLLSNSDSSSLTAVVASVVLANPSKFFNVAMILFSCPEVMLADRLRARLSESQTRGLHSIGAGMNYRTKFFEEERLRTCDDAHRNHSLEDLIIKYQFFREKEEAEDVVEKRQQEIWVLIDRIQSTLPSTPSKSDFNKTIQLLLAGIDRRTMSPKVEEKDNRIYIEWNAKIDPELENHSKEAIAASNTMMKYAALKLWANYKFDKSKKYGDYPQYEGDPHLVLKETREIVAGMKDASPGDEFLLFNHSTPAFACSTLIKDYLHALTQEDKEFCIETIIEYATAPLRRNYGYQIADGVEASINALPNIIDHFPDKSDDCLLTLLLLMFDATPIGQYKRICDYSLESIQRGRQQNGAFARKMTLAFLKFQPQFRQVKENYDTKQRAWRPYPQDELVEKFIRENTVFINEFFSSPLTAPNFNPTDYDLRELEILFQLIPHDTTDTLLINLVSKTLPLFAERLLNDDEKVDYMTRIRIFKRIALFILFREPKEVKAALEPFVEHFCVSEEMTHLFEEFIWAEDRVEQYEQFWIVWYTFYEKFKESIDGHEHRHFSGQIHTYLLAWQWWKETAESWHSLKVREIAFFQKVVKDMGSNTSVLYSVSKVLNDIGSTFLNDGVQWLSEMIEKRSHSEPEPNTVYYLERLMRKYVHLNRTSIRKSARLRSQVLTILDFLIERSSVTAYLLREDIL